MKLECFCGAKALPCPTLNHPVTCQCGITYAASVDFETVYRRTRELTTEVARLTRIADATALASAKGGG